jgi:hypothetical protein
MKNKVWLQLAVYWVGAVGVLGGIITEPTRTFTVGQAIANVQDPPRVFSQVIADSSITSLTEVRVSFRLVGDPDGFASEMYVSLTKDLSLVSVLVNQVGVTDLNPLGFGYNGWDVTLSDLAGEDIHTRSLVSGVLTGDFQPDGRVLGTDTSRPATLGVFLGRTGNGRWDLGVADLFDGGVMRLESWSLTLKGVSAVPESETGPALAVAGVAFGIFFWGRRRFRTGRQDEFRHGGNVCS